MRNEQAKVVLSISDVCSGHSVELEHGRSAVKRNSDVGEDVEAVQLAYRNVT
jgi:hypothetical protein